MEKNNYSPTQLAPSDVIDRSQSAAIINNRIEAIRTLSTSLLSELETLKKDENPEHPDRIDLAKEVDRLQIDLIRTALLRTGGRQRAAARLLNVKSTTLHAKMKRYHIHEILNDHNP